MGFLSKPVSSVTRQPQKYGVGPSARYADDAHELITGGSSRGVIFLKVSCQLLASMSIPVLDIQKPENVSVSRFLSVRPITRSCSSFAWTINLNVEDQLRQ